jgi:hypothetical protein
VKGPEERVPIFGIFAGCCASAMTDTASSITATIIDEAAAFFIACISFVRRLFSTCKAVVKSVVYGRRNQLFLRGENTKFGFEIELNDATVKSCRIERRRIQFNPGIVA